MKNNYIVGLAFFLMSFITIAQNGNIQGTIIDENGLKVPFSNVMIPELKKGSISDADGKFSILDIPAGTYTITVKYLGYADSNTEVVVENYDTTTITIQLQPEALELDDVVVTGYTSGQAKALNAQKNKQNITNIVSTDQIGKYPDANIGDAVKRIPGITMQVDQGEARNIIVRGLAPQLNSVTLNGSRIPSAEGDNRNVQMDLIPADMIQLIEVNKSVTPDMDGDALGGSVNLVTRTAPESFRFGATLGSGRNFVTDENLFNGSLLIGDRTKDKKFGWMVSASIYDNDFGSDNVEAEWVDEAENEITGEDVPMVFVEESDIRTYIVRRIRRSFSANFDYAINPNNVLYLKTMYNWRDDRENRYRLRYRSMAPNFTDANNNFDGYTGEIRRQTKGGIDSDRNKNTRLEDQRMQNYSLGGDHVFGNVEFDWMVSYAEASEERNNERYIEYELEETADGNPIPLNQDLSDPEFPLISARNSSDVLLSRFALKEITEENQFTDEKDYNAFVNAKFPADFFGKGEGFVKVGARLKLKEKQRDNNFFEFEPIANEHLFNNLSIMPLIDLTDPDFLAGSQYAAGAYVDPEFLGQLHLMNASLFEMSDVPDEYVRANFNVEEDVYAGYAMANQKVSEKLSVLAGIRIENTRISATGNQILNEEDVIGTITSDNSYTSFLPNLQFKYDLNERTVLRFAWTNTIARPNYADLVPSVDVLEEDEEIVLGNPNLDATTSMNFDVIGEHYFKNVGIISGGLFYKQIKDFIYTFQFEDAATGFDTFQPQNGDDATIFGAEFSFQRQLDFMPGFAKNFSVLVNYTYLSSSADGIRNEDGDERTDLDLPGTAPHMFNGSLAYADKGFNFRLSANFSDAYIDEIGGNAFEDRYYDEQFLLDFNASVAVTPNLRLYVDVNNITDQPLRYYQGVKSRTMQVEYYGRRVSFGVKYDLFKNKK